MSDSLPDVMQPLPPLDELEQYYDAVPRSRTRVETVGPFSLFVASSGWPYYARPVLGGPVEIRSDDVRRVFSRQRDLDVPQAIEWVSEVTPGLAEVVEATGTPVARCPLLVLDGPLRGTAGTARMLGADAVEELVASRAAVSVAFGHNGTATGPAGIAERDANLDSTQARVDDTLRSRLAAGECRMAAVWDPQAPHLGPVGGGSYSPVGRVAEIAGVGVLPAFRRRGLAAQVTHVLAFDALATGVTTVFCSAQSDDVARVYEGVGFVRVGTACIAERTPD